MSTDLANKNEAARRSAVVAALEHPMDCKELSERIGVSYYTLKPVLNRMVADGVIQASPFRVGGSTKYERLLATNMPMFQHYETKQWLTLKEWLDLTMPLMNGEGAAIVAIKNLPRACWELLNLARRVELGASSDADIASLRAAATEQYRKAQNVAKFWEQVLAYAPLWDSDGLRKIAESPDYPDDKELSGYAERFGS